MVNLQEILERRMKRILLSAEATTKKIIKKEFNKMKKELIKGIMKNG